MKSNKMRLFASLCLVIVMFGISPLCSAEPSDKKVSIDEVKRETQDLITALKAYTADQRDEATEKTKAALDKLDKHIENLEASIDKNWDKMDKAGREKSRASIKALRKQRTKVAEWYGSLKTSSVGAWEHMKKGFSDAYNSLHSTWEKSEKEFGSGD